MALVESNRTVFQATWKPKTDYPNNNVVFRFEITEQEIAATIFLVSLTNEVLLTVSVIVDGERIKLGSCRRHRINQNGEGDAIVSFISKLEEWTLTAKEQSLFKDKNMIVQVKIQGE